LTRSVIRHVRVLCPGGEIRAIPLRLALASGYAKTPARFDRRRSVFATSPWSHHFC
jgi:hypothetical protein